MPDVTVTTLEDTPVAISLVATDPDGNSLEFTVESPAHGTVSGAPPLLTYTPEADFNGTDSFVVTASDGDLSVSATVSIIVQPVDDGPVAVDDTAETDEDVALVVDVATLLANDVGAGGTTLTVTAVDGAENGTVELAGDSVTFTPAADFNGSASFTYTVSDGTLTDTGTVQVTVNAVNDAPVAVEDTAATDEDVALVVDVATLLANDTDADGDALTVTAVDGAENGTVELAGDSVTFTPAADFNGSASFTYTVSDGTLTDTGTVQVTVNAVNDAPVAVEDTAATDEDVALVVDVATLLANDTDADGDALTVTAVDGAENGTVELAGDSVTFTPAADFNGSASFTYTVSDGTLTDTGTVQVTVNAVNDAPVAQDQTVAVAMNGSGDITLSGTDVEGDALTFAVVTMPSHGTLSGTGASLTYTPDTDYTGSDSFTFRANDGSLDSAEATVTLDVVAPACGNSLVEPPEVCDDGNRTAGDGCRADCGGFEVCGDGQLDSIVGEQCDDANTENGDGCSSTCQLDPFSNVPPQVISGTLSCKTEYSNSGRKVAVDALGRFFVVMNCEGTAYVAVSLDRGVSWLDPVSTGITGVAEVAIEGGPTGTAYVVAGAQPGNVVFTRTTDAGATWEAPRVLSPTVDPEISIDASGDAVYIATSNASGNLRVLRNYVKGMGEFLTTDVAVANFYHDVFVDKISGDIVLATDDPSFRLRISSDQGATFGPESNPPGQAFYSDWTGSNGFLYVVGTFGDNNIDRIPLSNPSTSEQVTGLPANTGQGPFRAIDSDPIGNAYVVSQLDTGSVQLDRMLFGAATINPADARPIAAGTFPGVVALPSNNGALVTYTNGTSVYGTVIVY